MANVFTKKNKRPRTTTLRDFGRQIKLSALLGSDAVVRPEVGVCLQQPGEHRVLSPTRRCNPHPPGLVSQSPYNKDNNTFDIWNPNFVKINRSMPEKMTHLKNANFCSGTMPEKHIKKGPPEIRYALTSVSRISYQTPRYPSDTDYRPVVTRFGFTPYKPASGIVPNTLPPIYKPKVRL